MLIKKSECIFLQKNFNKKGKKVPAGWEVEPATCKKEAGRITTIIRGRSIIRTLFFTYILIQGVRFKVPGF